MGRIILLLFIYALFILNINAQIFGKITDNKGEPLPFAAVYIEGTTQGTFSNEEGEYLLKLNQGMNKVVYKYITYQTKQITVEYKGKRIEKNIALETNDLVLKEVVILADAEDPAYAIIRKAVKSRNLYKDKPENFKSKLYQKFKLELLDAPKKIMGIEVAKTKEDKKEMEELLDSNTNILLVTETISEFYKTKGDRWKEKIISSRISGDKKGYSNMSSLFTKLSFYNNFIQLRKNMISPISSNAMLFYKYKLIGTFIDNDGNTVNKIQVIPKRKYDPVFRGFIFITEDIWNIHGLDLETDSKNTNIRLLDTIRIKQDFRQLTDHKNEWGLLSQYSTFNIGFMGFKAHGYHTRNFIDYNLNQNYPDGFFDNVQVKVEEGSNKRDSVYWDEIRPIPLSVKEKNGYHRMDSIETYTSSKEYLDSLDKESNRFKIKDLFTSYGHSNSYENSYWAISSPILGLGYNPIQGLNSSIRFIYKKTWENKSFVKFKLGTEYGFADKQFLPMVRFEQMIDNKYKFHYLFKAGRTYAQPSDKPLVNSILNAEIALFKGKSFLKLYDKRYLKLGVKRDFMSGIKLRFNIDINTRSKLINHTNYSFTKNHVFQPNIYEKSGEIKYKSKLLLNIGFSYKPGTRYVDMPYELQALYSPYPTIYVNYGKAISLGANYVSYDLIKVGLFGSFSSGLLGRTYYKVDGGKYLTKNKVDVLDDQYFSGNQMYIMLPSDYYKSFHLLPFYIRANFSPYYSIRLQQKFKGFFIGKIPYLNRLKMEEVITFKMLQIEEDKLYYELGAGLDKILGVFSLRYSWAFKGNKSFDNGIRFSFNVPITFVRD